MTRISLYAVAASLVLAAPVRAQEPDWSEFQELMERFSQESQAFMQEWMTELSPMLENLLDKIDDLSNYEPPEVLPNGDIIIRRKPDVSPLTPPETPPEDQIEL